MSKLGLKFEKLSSGEESKVPRTPGVQLITTPSKFNVSIFIILPCMLGNILLSLEARFIDKFKISQTYHNKILFLAWRKERRKAKICPGIERHVWSKNRLKSSHSR